MRVIYGPRCSGKTFELMRMAQETDRYIIVPNRREADRILKEAKRNGFDIRRPMTPNDCLTSRRTRGVSSVLVDDVGAILADVLNLPRIDALTVCAREHLQLETRFPPETIELMRSMGLEVDE